VQFTKKRCKKLITINLSAQKTIQVIHKEIANICLIQQWDL